MPDRIIHPNLINEYLVQASSARRTLNFLIDLYVVEFVWKLLNITANTRFYDSRWVYNGTPGEILTVLIAYTLIYVITIGCMEAVANGKTIGKFITGTKAVNSDGSAITFSTALLRSIYKSIPFEAFSALGDPCYPWHDKWTNTCVIDIKKSNLAKENTGG